MKIFLTAVITALFVTAIASGVGYFIFQKQLSQVQTDVAEMKNRQPANTNLPPLTSNSVNGQPQNTPTQVSNDQPENQPATGDILQHAVFMTSSTDPTDFADASDPTFLKGSVPELLVLTQNSAAGQAGDLLLYFPSFENFTQPGEENLVMTKSTDAGKTWSELQTVTIATKENPGAAVDPSAVQLADGSIRLFYYGPSAPLGGVPTDPAKTEGDHTIYSAVSNDGLNFTADAGERFAKEKITDPEVIYHSGRWLLYYSVGQTTGIASSADGLNFEDTEFSWSGGGIPGAYIDDANYVHLYGCNHAGIVTTTSGDGVTFTGETETALTTSAQTIICDPSPVQLADGTIVLTYKKVLPETAD